VLVDRDDVIVDEFDVVAFEAAQPAAVVLQHPLGHRRVLRGDLGGEFGVVADLVLDPFDEDLAPRRAGGVGGVWEVRPIRFGPNQFQQLVAGLPHQHEPVPAGVPGQVPHRPLLAVGHVVVVARVGRHPLRGALEDGQGGDVVDDGRPDLEAAGPGADEGDALAAQIHRVFPLRGVEHRPGEPVQALDVGDQGRLSTPTPEITTAASRVCAPPGRPM
jgi:hypothetical protein